MYALVMNDIVEQVAEDTFPVCDCMKWVEITDDKLGVKSGWGYIGGHFAAPILPPVDMNRIVRRQIQILRDQIQDALLDFAVGGTTKVADLQALKAQLVDLEGQLDS